MGGGFSAFLQALAGQMVNRKAFKWFYQNWRKVFLGWVLAIFLVNLLLGLSVVFKFQIGDWWPRPFHEWYRAGGELYATAWTLFYAVGITLIPVGLLSLPLIVAGIFLWGALYFIGGFALLTAGPFIILTGLRAFFFHYAAKSLAEADNRAKEERGVLHALGMGDAPERTLEGKARLMDLDEFKRFKDIPRKGAKTLVGTFHEWPFQYATEKHVLIVAGTRGGKGYRLILPNLYIYEGSVFVLDPKGENAQWTQKARQKYGPVFALDPFGVSGLPSARFNPLRYLAGPSMITDAQTLADALIVGDDHFTSSARQLLVGLMLYVVTEPVLTVPGYGGPVGRDLMTVRRLLMRDLKTTLESMVKNKADLDEVKTIITDIAAWGKDTAEKEWSGIKNSAIEQTKWLNSPEVCAVLEEGDGTNQIDFADYLKGIMSVFVCLPAPYFATFDKWLRLVVAAALDTMTKRLAPPPLPVRFVLDEVAQLGNLAKIESALTLSAGYGVQLWGIWQHLKDIERCYPRSGVGGWVSSSGLRLVFAVQDNETIRYFATATGDAMTETDIRHMPPSKILCLMDGANPLLVDRFLYKGEREAQAGAQAA